ncbi:leucine-rich repeat domain-containing protein [Blastopirellula marina]|uniref:Leucine Rich repeats (2 copies) n=1 Tax=Blastopirellula marina TaxID=124 RepID=A0A2S8FXL5_9BACT|nr:hypothetical protein [Blastopirellula marina]PQO36584.1 hypothetical protein C5Y98_11350 [Blastopirellula marina]PTL44414.1 hypothetical protein C5Y97_11360 [Blastopirellula marina]
MFVAVQPKPRRRWLSFSLRALLVLMTILCVFLGWIGPRWLEMTREEAAVKKILEQHGWAHYDYQEEALLSPTPPTPNGPYLLRYLFGDHIFSRVVSVGLRHQDEQDESTRPNPNQLVSVLPNLKHVRWMWFEHSYPLQEETLQCLLNYNQLETLTLDDSGISADQLARFAVIDSITHISLTGEDASDAHLAKLSQFPNLKSLSIDVDVMFNPNSPQHTPVGVRHLGKIATLESLTLRSLPRNSDEAIAALVELKHLKKLDTDEMCGFDSSLTERCLPYVFQIESLEELHMRFKKSNVRFEPEQYQGLDRLTGLKYLCLEGSNVHDEIMPVIGKLTNLETLNLNRSWVTSEGVAALTNLKKLKRLGLTDTRFDLEDLPLLDQLDSLEVLAIGLNRGFTDERLQDAGYIASQYAFDGWVSLDMTSEKYERVAQQKKSP